MSYLYRTDEQIMPSVFVHANYFNHSFFVLSTQKSQCSLKQRKFQIPIPNSSFIYIFPTQQGCLHLRVIPLETDTFTDLIFAVHEISFPMDITCCL